MSRFDSLASLLPVLALCTVAAPLGCGGTYVPSRSGAFDPEPATEINDDDVRKAFDAHAQLGETVRVAYYTFDPDKAGDVDAMLKAIPAIKSVYRIPQLVVTGERRFQENNPWQPAHEVSLKKLRVLAAHAHADVLVVIDHGFRCPGVNPLVALDLLVVPVFFVPFLDNEVESYAEAFVIDTRNGYLYGHASEDEKSGPEYATIYADGWSKIAESQWGRLRDKLGADVTRVLNEGHQQEAPRVSSAATSPRE